MRSQITTEEEAKVMQHLQKHGRCKLSEIEQSIGFKAKATLKILTEKKQVKYIFDDDFRFAGYQVTNKYIPTLKQGTICNRIINLIEKGITTHDEILLELLRNHKRTTTTARLSELKTAGLIIVLDPNAKNKEYKINK